MISLRVGTPNPTLASRSRANISRIFNSIVDAARNCIGYRSDSREQEAAESETMAAEEGCREHRKRRERHDSGAHERKERRALSEERARPDTPPTPALHDYNRLEVERRAERLSRARRPQYGAKRRRPAPRVPHTPKENECFLNSDDTVRCSSPPLDIHFLYKQQQRADNIDLGSLHRQLCGSEPARSVAAQRAPPDAENDHPTRPDDLNTGENREDKLRRKISNLKKNIALHESAFAAENSRTMTQADRIIDVQLTRMYENLRRLQSEKRLLKSDPAEYAIKLQAAKLQKQMDEKLDIALKSEKPMSDLVLDIEQWLESCRKLTGREASPETNWTASQLAAEKACVQRALLRLEAARGRPPAHSADRGASRHLYERYRTVKRALAAVRPDAIGNGELATIHEHEAMLFNTSIDSSSEEKDQVTENTQEETTSHEPSDEPVSSPSSATADESPQNEGLHCLGTDELDKLLHNAKLQKSLLRRSIKEYEVSFEVQNSRKIQRDDKISHEEDYTKYKAIKARIKLLNALINKQKIIN